MTQTIFQPIHTNEAATSTVKSIGINPDQVHEHDDQQTTVEPNAVKSVKDGVWSDPTVWNPKGVPSFNDNVLISSGTTVTYDIHSTNAIGNLTIVGNLLFSKTKSTNLDVGTITVDPKGKLEIGTKDNPIPSRYTTTIRFVMNTSGQSGLIIHGQGEIHGSAVTKTFTKLASDAIATKQEPHTLFVEGDVQDWPTGSKIIITTTGRSSCTELNTIKVAGSRTITLNEPLRCYHSGTGLAKGEVALLTRNVVITSKDPNLRGHTMFMEGARGSISYAEFVSLGPQNQLGKYPIHFHQMGDGSKGMYVQGASIWNSTNRWITIHSSNDLVLKDNVGYSSVGHGYFLEAGNEMNNVIDHNIGIQTTAGKLIPSDGASAVLWLENARNKVTNNIAVQGQYYGYKYDVPNRVQDLKSESNVNLRTLSILQFDKNEAHNNGVYGMWTSAGAQHDPKNQTIAASVVKNFLTWRNGSWGVYMEGRGMTVTDSTIFGNRMNVGFGSDNNVVSKSHIMGEVDKDSTTSTAGIFFDRGVNNIIEDSIIEGHTSKDGRTYADVKISNVYDGAITGKLVNTTLLSTRTIILGYPQNSLTHLIVEDYSAPNDNHSSLPSNFTLWRIDNPLRDAIVDPYFVALVQKD
jgi:hypothetical protein